ncbi:hypothetical protein ACFV3R_24985 [Streptomyces sp. NPDC059740]|uniref:hypothetical protein n=1 Tax=Streptomyces sp. NPDC059740 TaxID=3346926 RepID=UPI0036571E6E
MPLLNFDHLLDGDQTEPDVDDGSCACQKPDDQYLMAIEEGQVSLRHATCGKPPNWGDWTDLTYSDPVPVRAEWKREGSCTGAHYSDYTYACDCDHWVQITLPGETA